MHYVFVKFCVRLFHSISIVVVSCFDKVILNVSEFTRFKIQYDFRNQLLLEGKGRNKINEPVLIFTV